MFLVFVFSCTEVLLEVTIVLFVFLRLFVCLFFVLSLIDARGAFNLVAKFPVENFGNFPYQMERIYFQLFQTWNLISR